MQFRPILFTFAAVNLAAVYSAPVDTGNDPKNPAKKEKKLVSALGTHWKTPSSTKRVSKKPAAKKQEAVKPKAKAKKPKPAQPTKKTVLAQADKKPTASAGKNPVATKADKTTAPPTEEEKAEKELIYTFGIAQASDHHADVINVSDIETEKQGGHVLDGKFKSEHMPEGAR
jgi:hypothetical protein